MPTPLTRAHPLARAPQEDVTPQENMEIEKWLNHVLRQRRRAIEAAAANPEVAAPAAPAAPAPVATLAPPPAPLIPGATNGTPGASVGGAVGGASGPAAAAAAAAVPSVAVGEKSILERLADIRANLQEEEAEADPLITNGVYPLDSLKGVRVSFTVNLFPGGFSIEGQNEAHPYDREYKDFLHCIDTGILPADALLDIGGHVDFTYYDGCLIAEVRDHRFPRQLDLKPEVHRVLLRPDNQTVTSDLRTICRRFQNLTMDDILLLERHMLLAIQPRLCLDPSPVVARIATHLHRSNARVQVSNGSLYKNKHLRVAGLAPQHPHECALIFLLRVWSIFFLHVVAATVPRACTSYVHLGLLLACGL